MTSISKTVNTDRLDDIVKEYNNTYYSFIKMEAGNVHILFLLYKIIMKI